MRAPRQLAIGRQAGATRLLRGLRNALPLLLLTGCTEILDPRDRSTAPAAPLFVVIIPAQEPPRYYDFYYGNWCGPKWSGGVYDGGIGDANAVDNLDKACRDHDLAYEAADEKWLPRYEIASVTNLKTVCDSWNDDYRKADWALGDAAASLPTLQTNVIPDTWGYDVRIWGAIPISTIERIAFAAKVVEAVPLMRFTNVPPCRAPPASLEVEPDFGRLIIGQTLQLSATLRTATGLALPTFGVRWSSSDKNIATVSSNGVVTARKLGAAEITALVNGEIAVVIIQVVPRPAAKLVFLVGPSNTTVGTPFSPPIQVGVVDSQGGIVSAATNVIYLSIVDAAGAPAGLSDGVNIIGAVGVHAVNGIAVFPSYLAASAAGKGYRLKALDCGNPAVNGDCVPPNERLIGAFSATFNVR